MMSCLNGRLKTCKFGWLVIFSGILAYILGPKQRIEWRLILDLAKTGLNFEMKARYANARIMSLK